METFALIMAGGRGKRFWPYSREKTPKQFLSLRGEKTMLQNTVDRILPIINNDRIFTIVSKGQKKAAQNILSYLPENSVIEEPVGKDTALCVGLGAILCRHINPESLQIVMPADHLILNEDKFRTTLALGQKVAEETGALVTIGINPSRPETGYGYIQYDVKTLPGFPSNVNRVKTFAEKPNIDTAERFLKSGDFIWNSGIFIWKTSSILREFEHSLPEM